MGRLYSGSLNDFKAQCNRLYQMDFAVIAEGGYDSVSMRDYMELRVEDRAGNAFATESFAYHDADVLYNTATDYLRNLADQLSTWSKPE